MEFPRRRERELAKSLSPAAEEAPKQRIVLLKGTIDDDKATMTIVQLLFLEWEDAHRSIKLRIDSPGGRVTAGMAIVDTVRRLSPPVHTECWNEAHGMAAIILACGQKGQRLAGRNAAISLVPTVAGNVEVADVHAKLERTQQQLARILAELCDQPESKIVQDLTSGRSFTPQEALEFGLVDQING
jgi:ATP-dependent Clp protease protease subunit